MGLSHELVRSILIASYPLRAIRTKNVHITCCVQVKMPEESPTRVHAPRTLHPGDIGLSSYEKRLFAIRSEPLERLMRWEPA